MAIDPNQYVTHQQKITRSTNKLQFQTYSTTKDYFKYSFFPHASGTHYQPALLCQASPWISLKLCSEYTCYILKIIFWVIIFMNIGAIAICNTNISHLNIWSRLVLIFNISSILAYLVEWTLNVTVLSLHSVAEAL